VDAAGIGPADHFLRISSSRSPHFLLSRHHGRVSHAPGHLVTPRLLLRRWTDVDRSPFAAMNADPEVMRHFPSPLDREESDRLLHRFEAGFEERGYGLWALERRDDGTFIGFAGLQPSPADVPCDGLVEVGWRLATRAWHQGFATEAAHACLGQAFGPLGLPAVCSFTAVRNAPSTALMRRLGMTEWRRFGHPRVRPDSPLHAHVAYRLDAGAWAKMGPAHQSPSPDSEETP
jgi:RimJ/RimL family protein N-acetyltransferase